MQKFLQFIRNKGFKACPICGENETFTWGNRTKIEGVARDVKPFIQGFVEMGEGEDSARPLQLNIIVLICGQCGHIMNFSETFYKAASENEQKDDHA